MTGRRRVATILLTALAAGVVGVKFSIDAQVDQIFRIIEKTQMAIETSDMKMVMTPADFNFIVPFTIRMTCSNGLMIVQDMRRIHQEDIYMDAMNDNETHISVRFTVSEMDFKYELCWLSLIIPVPLWLRGKILQSTYYVTSKISYNPSCEFTITKASLESYEKMSLNVFNWLPGGLGDAMTEMLTRNTQDRIYDTVSKSIEKTLMKLSTVYDACVAFPAMGRLTELPQLPDELEEESEDNDDPLLAVVERDEDKENESNSGHEDNAEPARQVNENEQTQIPTLVETQRMQLDPTTSTESSTTILGGGHGKDKLDVNTVQHHEKHEKDTTGGSTDQIKENDQVWITAMEEQRGMPDDQAVYTDNVLLDDSETDSNKIGTGCTKNKPADIDSSDYYEIIRRQIMDEESKKKSSLIDGKKNVENTFELPDGSSMKSAEEPLLGPLKNNKPDGKKRKKNHKTDSSYRGSKESNYGKTEKRHEKLPPKKLKFTEPKLKEKELKEFQKRTLEQLNGDEGRCKDNVELNAEDEKYTASTQNPPSSASNSKIEL